MEKETGKNYLRYLAHRIDIRTEAALNSEITEEGQKEILMYATLSKLALTAGNIKYSEVFLKEFKKLTDPFMG